MDINEEIKPYFKSLTDQTSIDLIDNEYAYNYDYGDPADCADLASFLSEELAKNSSLSGSYPDLYDYYQMVVTLLSFKAFAILSTNAQHDLLQKRFLYAIQKGFNFDELVKKYFAIYYDEPVVQNAFRSFVNDLQQNSETLGAQSLEIEGRRLLPQIKNWILDYSKTPSKSAKRGSIDRLNYLNQDPNVRSLTQGQRQTLSKVLKAYDDFVNADNPNPRPKLDPAAVAAVAASFSQPLSAQPGFKLSSGTIAPPIPRPPAQSQQVPSSSGQTFAPPRQQLAAPSALGRPTQQSSPYSGVQLRPQAPQQAQASAQPPRTLPQQSKPAPEIDIARKLEDLKNRKK